MYLSLIYLCGNLWTPDLDEGNVLLEPSLTESQDKWKFMVKKMFISVILGMKFFITTVEWNDPWKSVRLRVHNSKQALCLISLKSFGCIQ